MKVGGARGRYGVKAPAIIGNEIFERHFRVQQNTLELLVILLPGLYLFSRYFSPFVAAGLGLVYLIGREIYALSYVKDPAKAQRRLWLEFPAGDHPDRRRLDRRRPRTLLLLAAGRLTGVQRAFLASGAGAGAVSGPSK